MSRIKDNFLKKKVYGKEYDVLIAPHKKLAWNVHWISLYFSLPCLCLSVPLIILLPHSDIGGVIALLGVLLIAVNFVRHLGWLCTVGARYVVHDEEELVFLGAVTRCRVKWVDVTRFGFRNPSISLVLTNARSPEGFYYVACEHKGAKYNPSFEFLATGNSLEANNKRLRDICRLKNIPLVEGVGFWDFL